SLGWGIGQWSRLALGPHSPTLLLRKSLLASSLSKSTARLPTAPDFATIARLMTAETILNRKALRDYRILERYEAGLELKGSEVKSIRAGKANINDAFARIENGEAFLYNADIQPYERASHEIPSAKRVRKLLLHRAEIDKLYGETQVGGRALVLLNLHGKNEKRKAEIAVAQEKVARDKRADLKKRATDRETAREGARVNRKHGEVVPERQLE